jgi:hypothetical protein
MFCPCLPLAAPCRYSPQGDILLDLYSASNAGVK